MNFNEYSPEVKDLILGLAKEILASLSSADLETLTRINRERGLYSFHHGVGTGVRNGYNLWSPKCPLTYPWFTDRAGPRECWTYMDRGVDCHPNHPDQVSHSILVVVWNLACGRHPFHDRDPDAAAT